MRREKMKMMEMKMDVDGPLGSMNLARPGRYIALPMPYEVCRHELDDKKEHTKVLNNVSCI